MQHAADRRGLLLWIALAGAAALLGLPAAAAANTNGAHVVLLHGMARTPRSMAPLARYLADRGYTVWNLGYPSRQASVETLAVTVRRDIVAHTAGAERVHVIAHSLGGILVRQIQARDPLPNLGRVVMLAPPNAGSEVVDRIGDWSAFRWLNGPAGAQLGTDGNSAPNRLGPVAFELGVLTGDRSINWINSLMLPGPDDGKVTIRRAAVGGMRELRVLPVSHPMIMRDRTVMELCARFLEHGTFSPP